MAENVILADSRAIGAYPHGMLYYDGYIYIIHRDDGFQGAKIDRINANYYNDKQTKVVVGGFWSMAAGLTDIIRIGNYLYCSSHRPRVGKIYIPTFTPSSFGLPLNSADGDCLCADETYIYIGHRTFNGKITRVNIATEENDVFDGIEGGADWHGICEDGPYLYANNNADGYLHKILKATMASVGNVAIGICTDDMAQDATYVYLGRESGTAGLIQVRKSDLAINVFTPGGMGFCYGVFIIDDVIYYLDKTNDSMWICDVSGPSYTQWDLNPPDSYAGVNELVFDSDGGRLFHATLYDTVGLMAYAIENVTLDETSKLQVIKARMGEIIAEGAGNLTLSVSNSFVNTLSAKISYRTISQGHSLFSAILDNIPGTYTNQFDAREPIVIKYKGLEIFKGVLDTARHLLSQDDKWDLSDYMRLSGRDWSFDLANLKYMRTWPVGQQVIHAIYEMLIATGCDVSIVDDVSGPIDGYVSVDKYLLDLVVEMFEIARLEGYVDMNKVLKHYELDSLNVLPITFDKTNVLSGAPVEFDGLDIRNSIEILGDLNLEEPELADSWTDEDSLPMWEKILGTTLWVQDDGIINKCIKCSTELIDGAWHAYVRLTLPERIKVGYQGQYKYLDFWHYIPPDLIPDNDHFTIYLVTSEGNYFHTEVSYPSFVFSLGGWGDWKHFQLKIGVEETNTAGFPEGMWHPVGNPDWLNITQVEFYGIWNGDNVDDAIIIDGLKFTPKRTHYLKEDYVSIGKYHKREFLQIIDAKTNEECKLLAESLAIRMGVPVSVLQIVTPLDTFIIAEAWRGGEVGSEVEVNLPNVAIGTYRIQDITVDIVPYMNLRSGHDAIATVNLIPVAAEFYPDSYAAAARQEIFSLMKRKENKGA